MTINYLLGNLGKVYQNTVGVVDLGGGSVQMAYAISEDDALTAPKISDGEDNYVKELFLKRTKYFLYVHRLLLFSMFSSKLSNQILHIITNSMMQHSCVNYTIAAI